MSGFGILLGIIILVQSLLIKEYLLTILSLIIIGFGVFVFIHYYKAQEKRIRELQEAFYKNKSTSKSHPYSS